MTVTPLNIDDPALDAPTCEAIAEEKARAGRVTNMKRYLLRSLPAYRLFSDVLPLKSSLRQAIGDRAVSVFSHAISENANCLLCSTYFRKALKEHGVSPQEFQPTDVEALLITLARQMTERGEGEERNVLPALQQRFGERTVVEIVAYGAAMLATNVLNTTLGVPLDDDLKPFLAS
jgi:alkylhydroperoxidase family enzyme